MFEGLIMQLIPQELLNILACPKCKGDLELDQGLQGLVCHQCALLYEIREGIPIMLIDEAKPLDQILEKKKDE